MTERSWFRKGTGCQALTPTGARRGGSGRGVAESGGELWEVWESLGREGGRERRQTALDLGGDCCPLQRRRSS